MIIEKADKKTTKSAFDLQIENADKQKGGISFVRKNGNSIEYVNIQSAPAQRFHYFYNPSKLTSQDRQTLEQKIIARKQLFPTKSVAEIVDEL